MCHRRKTSEIKVLRALGCVGTRTHMHSLHASMVLAFSGYTMHDVMPASKSCAKGLAASANHCHLF